MKRSSLKEKLSYLTSTRNRITTPLYELKMASGIPHSVQIIRNVSSVACLSHYAKDLIAKRFELKLLKEWTTKTDIEKSCLLSGLQLCHLVAKKKAWAEDLQRFFSSSAASSPSKYAFFPSSLSACPKTSINHFSLAQESKIGKTGFWAFLLSTYRVPGALHKIVKNQLYHSLFTEPGLHSSSRFFPLGCLQVVAPKRRAWSETPRRYMLLESTLLRLERSQSSFWAKWVRPKMLSETRDHPHQHLHNNPLWFLKQKVLSSHLRKGCSVASHMDKLCNLKCTSFFVSVALSFNYHHQRQQQQWQEGAKNGAKKSSHSKKFMSMPFVCKSRSRGQEAIRDKLGKGLEEKQRSLTTYFLNKLLC